MDDPGHRKIHQETIPLAGGLAVFTGLLIPVICASLLVWRQSGGSHFDETLLRPTTEAGTQIPPSVLSVQSAVLLRHGMEVRAIRLAGILLGALGILVVGILDDKYELKPRTKFAGQVLIALFVAACGVRITLFVHNPIFHYAITVLWLVAVMNAFNFMDNMNGLCTGLAAIGAGYFAFIAAHEGQYLVAVIAFLACGALLGFLPRNFPQAKAFLGDAGSHLVGFLLAVLAMLPHFYSAKHPRPLAVLSPLLVLAVPLGDMAYVVFLRWRLGQPFYQGDNNHLSHRLSRRGLSKTKTVMVIWCIALLFGGLALFC
jgi:UDP-GlcNAc:undecaprenyl-phosphate GlcNAc-1-phosphate transferase